MIILECEQGSKEWHAARLGIPTCSNFSKIITNKTAKLSETAGKYMYDLLDEFYTGERNDTGSFGFMERGHIVEKKAVTFYELQHNVDTRKVGFILRDDRRVGGSPDRLVGDDGIVEIKCPSGAVHLSYMDGEEGIGYRAQCQGLLWLTGRQWIDTVSYHDFYPSRILRMARDEEYIKALGIAVNGFIRNLDEAKKRFAKRDGLLDVEIADLLTA